MTTADLEAPARRGSGWGRALQWGTGLAIVVLAILLVGSTEVTQALSQADVLLVGLAALVWMVTGLLGAYRIRRLLPAATRPTLGALALPNMAALLLSDVTPARAGYLALAGFLRRKRVEVHASLAAIASVQVIDFTGKAIVCLAAVPLLTQAGLRDDLRLPVLAGALVLAAGTASVAVVLWTARLPGMQRFLARLPFGKALARAILPISTEAWGHRGLLPGLLPATVVAYLLSCAEWYVVALSLGIDLPAHYFLILQPLGTALTFVPVSVAGFGLQEGGVTVILASLGVPVPMALAFSLLARFATLLGDSPGLAYFLRR